MKKIMIIFGTRPEGIKMCPLVINLKNDPEIECVFVSTGQHKEMLDQVLDLFKVKPDYDLAIMQQSQSLAHITTAILAGLEDILNKEKPDLVLVHGDTSTSFVAALAAFYHQIPVGHVEAGLRTYDKYSPFPEEMNRSLTGRIAELNFAPTITNKNNLLKENVAEEKIFVTGNTVIDALHMIAAKPYEFESEYLKNVDFEHKRVVAVTCHRRENLGEYMGNIFTAIARIAKEYDDVEFIYPVHLNPAVRASANKYLEGINNVMLVEPLSYQPFVNLMAKSYLILTDSGGMQEEGPALGKPVIVVRKETERPEAVDAGTVVLAGVEEEDVYKWLKKLLDDRSEYDKMARAINPYGDGKTCSRINRIIKNYLKPYCKMDMIL